MKKELVGFVTTTEILFGRHIEEETVKYLLPDIENTITKSLKGRFNCNIIGGLGGFIYSDKDSGLLVRVKETIRMGDKVLGKYNDENRWYEAEFVKCDEHMEHGKYICLTWTPDGKVVECFDEIKRIEKCK